MNLLRWMSEGSTTSDEPLPHSIAELRVTLIRLTAGDHVRMNIIRRVLESAVLGQYGKMCSYLANTSPKNKEILESAMREHDLVLWNPTDSSKLQLL